VRFVSNGSDITLPANVPITLTFQDQGQLSGRSAVNNYAGAFSATPDGKITIQLTAATQMAGPPDLMALEKAYFDGLGAVQQFSVSGNQVTLTGGTASLQFVMKSQQ